MDWTKTFLDVIDLRSFSSLWYWLVVAAVWSQASHWVLGVPYDVIQRARRQGGEAMADLEALTRVNVNRMRNIVAEAGYWLVGFAFFLHSGLLILAIVYGIEFALAVEMFLIPLTFVGVTSLFTGNRILTEAPEGEALVRVLIRHRFWTQVIGMIAIFVTACVGMYQLLYVPDF